MKDNYKKSIKNLCFTPDQARDFLCVGQTSLYALMKDDEIERIKFGGKTFITIKSCEDLVDRLLTKKAEVTQ